MTVLNTPNETTTVVDDPRRPAKAVAAGIISALAAGLSALVVAQGDNVVTSAEWTTVALAVVVAAGAAFGGTFAVSSPKVVKEP